MKERYKNKYGLLVMFFLLSMIFISANSATAGQYTFSLSYGDYYAISSGKEVGEIGSIVWSFEGSNTNVGISVWILDKDNFTKFSEKDPSLGFEVSDGSYYSASGSWTPYKTDVWYIVFIHADSDIYQTTTVNADVTIITGGLIAWVLVLIIGLPALLCVGVIVLVVVLVSRNKKKQQQYPQVTHQTYVTTPIAHPQEYPSPQLYDTSDIFCGRCGVRNSGDSAFCGKCGSRLDKP